MSELIATVPGCTPGVSFNVVLQRDAAHLSGSVQLWMAEMGPLVEFYDTRYPHTSHGQFVSRYYWRNLSAVTGGLCLHGGAPEWGVPPESMALVIAAVRKALANG